MLYVRIIDSMKDGAGAVEFGLYLINSSTATFNFFNTHPHAI